MFTGSMGLKQKAGMWGRGAQRPHFHDMGRLLADFCLDLECEDALRENVVLSVSVKTLQARAQSRAKKMREHFTPKQSSEQTCEDQNSRTIPLNKTTNEALKIRKNNFGNQPDNSTAVARFLHSLLHSSPLAVLDHGVADLLYIRLRGNTRLVGATEDEPCASVGFGRC